MNRSDGTIWKSLYEAANIPIYRVPRFSPLKSGAKRLAAHRGLRSVIVATTRKLAVIMTRIWRDETTFA